MHTAAAPAPRTVEPTEIASALLTLTARSWGMEMLAAEPTGMAAPAVATRPRRTALRLVANRPAQSARRTTADVDVTADQWPYWPTYPGLAAHWR